MDDLVCMQFHKLNMAKALTRGHVAMVVQCGMAWL